MPHPENILQFRNRQFLLLQQEQEAEPGRIGQEAEEING